MEVESFNIHVTLIEPGWFKTDIVDNGKVILDLNSPYAALEAAEYAGEQAAVAVAGDPRVVAAAIVKAATTHGPLHVPVGDDAETWIARTSTTTFEEWAVSMKAALGL